MGEITRKMWYQVSKELDPELPDETIEAAWQDILAHRAAETGKSLENQSKEE